MAITPLRYTKEWTDPVAFPTIENSETQVRADMQALYDEIKDYINNILLPAMLSPVTTTSAMTQPVGRDSSGQLWTAPGGGSGIAVDTVLDTGSTNPVQNSAIAAAIAQKANLLSPGFGGTPTAPTPAAGDSSLKIATTAFVQRAVANAIGDAIGGSY